MLAAGAALTCLMRGTVGEIMATDEGAALVTETLEACARTAAAAGHAPREKALASVPEAAARARVDVHRVDAARRRVREPDRGRAHRRRHAAARARAAGVEPGPLRAGYCHLQVYALRREREALARAAT